MLNQMENKVRIEGILSESDWKDRSFQTKDGKTIEQITGEIKVRVELKNPDSTVSTYEVPVYASANKYKKDGTDNPLYKSMCTYRDTFNSIASVGIDQADRVRITQGRIEMNEYYKNGKLISYPRITTAFINKITAENCNPEACFSTVFMVVGKHPEVDADGVETGKYIVNGLIPRYNGTVDVVPFCATDPNVVNAVSQYWEEGQTYKAIGMLNFTSRSEDYKVEVDFGTPITRTRTISVSDLVIMGGTDKPMEADFAIDPNEAKAALAERQERLNAMKERAENKSSTPAQTHKPKNSFEAFGF